MVRPGSGNFEQSEGDSFEPIPAGERPSYPCRKGTPKRTHYKKGAKHIRKNGKHRRRTRKIDW